MPAFESLPPALRETDIQGFKKYQGKVRDTYELSDDELLLVATDRLSAFDVVLEDGIPEKGKLLTDMSAFWFELISQQIPDLKHHMITTDVQKFGHGLEKYQDQLEGRSTLAKKLNIFRIEAIVRGYLTGSGLKDYKKTGQVCGIDLPKGLVEASRFEEPLFTPSTKAETGHDANISFTEMADIVGTEVAAKLRDLAVKIYTTAADYARQKGIIIADTKFEFGYDPYTGPEDIYLADEVLTPDSSRFWPADKYEVGKVQPSFDKQFVRNHLEDPALGWNKEAPAPRLPVQIIQGTHGKYTEAHNRLTGRRLRQ